MLITHASYRWASQKLERIPRGVRNWLISFFGVILLIMPVVLWAVMSFGAFKIAFFVWCTAFVAVVALIQTSPDEWF